ncbi:MAG: hypothetical protein KatS3mg008_2008 [Acidimicrobiales bacterium]|nr:MAG: hypothetical protein KatS3mg008_2008 [Acidimicrobiales bacterium]
MFRSCARGYPCLETPSRGAADPPAPRRPGRWTGTGASGRSTRGPAPSRGSLRAFWEAPAPLGAPPFTPDGLLVVGFRALVVGVRPDYRRVP